MLLSGVTGGEDFMVKSAPMRDHSIVIKPRRRSGGGLILLVVLLLAIGVFGLGFGFLAPAKLALLQERMISVLHGGVAGSEEHTYVDACVQVQGGDSPQAVTRTVRTTTFRDGTALSVTFSSNPTPTNSQCTG
jgi:hypothetical protein